MASPELNTAVTELGKTVSCPVCMDYLKAPVSLPCSHSYCKDCVDEIVKNSPKLNCPLCQKSFTRKNVGCVSKTLEEAVTSIKRFICSFEGRPLPEEENFVDEEHKVDKKFRIQRPEFKPGDLVHVAPRLWPGINKPGGAAWIQNVVESSPESIAQGSEDEIYYVCKYVIGGGIDFHVPAKFIRVANDINDSRESRTRRSKVVSSLNVTTSPAGDIIGNLKSKKKRKIERKWVDQDNNSSMETLTRRPLVLLCSTLTSDDLVEVQQFCDHFEPAEKIDSYTNSVSHIIVRTERKGKGKNQTRILKNRTMKYLQGVLGHKWIVSFEWIVESLKDNKLLDEALFEVTRDSKATSTSFGPKWSRESHSSLFDVGLKFVFAGPFCHPGPTVNNLSLLLRAGGGHVLDNISAVVDAINISLDGGLRVSRKSDPPLNELIAVIVTSVEAGNEFSRQVYMSICTVRKERSYDFGDFIDHLNGCVSVMHSDWIFDCISNYTLHNPLRCTRFRIDLDRSDNWVTYE